LPGLARDPTLRAMAPLTPLEIARIEERRMACGTRDVASDAEPAAGGYLCFDEPGSWANQAAGVGMDGPVGEADLDRMVTFYESRGVEPLVGVCTMADPSLVAGLAERGFVLREFENVLARELPADEDLDAAHPHGWPEGLEVRPVDPAEEPDVVAYVEVSTSGFRAPGQPVEPGLDELTRRVVDHPDCVAYLALLDGEPVGAGGMEASARGAALFGASVLPEARRRGVQLALMLRRMARARAAGCQLVTITSSPGIPTERNAARVGFRLAYARALLVRPGPGLVPSP
jgi:GNAT superfamily N-acetyltransferase